MTRTDKRLDVRAYQILKAAEGRGKLMVGKPVAKKKIDYCTAYEIVQRNSFIKPGTTVYAYRIVEAEIVHGKIMGAETAQGGDELTFDACADLIGKYKKFHAASVAAGEDPVEIYNGVIEIHFKGSAALDHDAMYDALWMLSQKLQNTGKLEIPEGIKLLKVTMPDDAIFLPEA